MQKSGIMISKSKLKLIRSLETKKGRAKAGLFVAEGPKTVGDLLDAGFKAEMVIDDADDVRQASFQQHPQGVIGVFGIPQCPGAAAPAAGKLTIALDGIQDPGNMGTIVRIADWFGIEDIFCSPDTADVWNPKTIQATMGSIARVRVHYTDLGKLIDSLPDGFPVYGTLLDGDNIYTSGIKPYGLVVMGNEGNGISDGIRRRITQRLLIPNYPEGRKTADSLNVATATAIICAEFRRRTYGTNL